MLKVTVLMNSFFASQSNCCPLVWMCHHRSLNNKISCLHKRCPRIAFNDSGSTVEDLSDKDRRVSIYVKNMQFLARKMFTISKKTCLSQ